MMSEYTLVYYPPEGRRAVEHVLSSVERQRTQWKGFVEENIVVRHATLLHYVKLKGRWSEHKLQTLSLWHFPVKEIVIIEE